MHDEPQDTARQAPGVNDVRAALETEYSFENRHRLLFEHSHDAIFLLTEQGYIDCNPRALDMFGFTSKEDMLRAHPADISPPVQPDGRSSLDAANEHIHRAMQEGMDSFEWTHRRSSGEDFPSEVLLSGFTLAGRMVVQATVRDITRRRQAEQALLEKTRELDSFFDLALDMLCIADTDGWFRRLNRAWCTTLGYSEEELFSRRFLEFVHPDDVESTIAAISTLSDQNPVTNFVNRYRCKDGRYRHIEWRSAPAGSLIYAAARDVTAHILSESSLRETNETLDRRVLERTRELQESEERLRALNEELEARVEERTQSLAEAVHELEAFSYSVSHDLRAPLRHINGFVELLAKSGQPLDEKARHWLDVIAQSARDMGQLIDDLLVFSRMGRTEMMQKAFNMGTLFVEVRAALAEDIGTRSIEWSLAAMPVVCADPSMLRLVVMNLLHNAVKYSRNRALATIECGCVEHEAEWEFFVRDNGAGFDMHYADKLFLVFQRLHSQNQFEGTGIGLANVHRIIKRHGGRTWAEGRVDEGATFHFTLPKREGLPNCPPDTRTSNHNAH